MTNDMPRSSEAHGHARVWQNGNPFSDAARMLAPTPITTVFDVGANCGDVAVHLLANFPAATVHAFEPNPAPFAHMVERFADEDRMVGIPAGVSDAPGVAELYVYGEDGLSAFSPLSVGSAAHLEGYGTDLVGTIEAELVTLDDYAAVEGIETVDLIKLDVQGWEVPCLRGATRLLSERRVRAVYAEVVFVDLYERQGSFEEITILLREHGLQLFSLYALSFDESEQLCWADALYLRR